MLPLQIIPPILQKLIPLHIPQLHPPTAAPHFAENGIGMVAEFPVEGAQLFGFGDAARGDLLDVDVGEAAVFVLGDGESDGGEADGFAEEPADVLLGGRVGG